MSPSRRLILQNIFLNAHEAARAIVAKERVSYRAAFSVALADEHKAAASRKATREADAASYLDCALGLPLRSCPADAKPRLVVSNPAPAPAFPLPAWAVGKPNVFTGLRPASRLYSRHSGSLAGRMGE